MKLKLVLALIACLLAQGCAAVIGRRPQKLGAEVHCILCVERDTGEERPWGFGFVWYP